MTTRREFVGHLAALPAALGLRHFLETPELILINGDIGRCVVTSRDPDTGVIDLPTLVTLASYRPSGATEHLPFGVYGSVLSPGRVHIKDRAGRLLEPLKT